MPRLSPADVQRMRSDLFFDGEERTTKLSRFWLLLLLSGVIAAAGIVSDSTATVIGAMIVAPLMTPILGVAVSIRLADRANFLRSLSLVVLGALAVIGIGLIFGFIIDWNIVAASNSQVAGRVSPHLIDLIAAFATGAVGAIALARSDISDTLPGVAIAISLVPPLAVVGLTAASGHFHQSGGALLLFITNVAAILASGTVVLTLYHLSSAATLSLPRLRRWRATITIVLLVCLVAYPLSRNSVRTRDALVAIQEVTAVVTPWAQAADATVASVTEQGGKVVVQVVGPLPGPSTTVLHDQLVKAGLGSVSVQVGYVPEQLTTVSGKSSSRPQRH